MLHCAGWKYYRTGSCWPALAANERTSVFLPCSMQRERTITLRHPWVEGCLCPVSSGFCPRRRPSCGTLAPNCGAESRRPKQGTGCRGLYSNHQMGWPFKCALSTDPDLVGGARARSPLVNLGLISVDRVCSPGHFESSARLSPEFFFLGPRIQRVHCGVALLHRQTRVELPNHFAYGDYSNNSSSVCE